MTGHEDNPREALIPAPVLLLLSILMVSGYVVLGRALSADIPPVGLVFWRTALATAVLGLLFAPRIRRQWPLLTERWRTLLLLGTLQAVTGHVLLLAALKSTTAINTGLLMATQPALTVAAACILLGDRLHAQQLAGLVIAAFGALAIVAHGDLGILFGLAFTPGDIFVALAMVSFAIYNATIPRMPRTLDPFVMFFGIVATTMAAITPLYAIELLWFKQRMVLDLETIAMVIYFALFASILGIVFLNTAIARMGPSRVGVYLYLLPIFIAGLAIIALDEAPLAYHFIGLAVVTLGVFLADHRRRL